MTEGVVDKEYLATECRRLHDCTQKNLNQLAGLCQTEETAQDYYLGMIRRQAVMTLDLRTILEKSPVDNLTTPAIICRCLIDDFLHMFYLHQEGNEEENIVRINAEAYAESFKSLNAITNSNHQHFQGRYTLYTTGTQLQQVKEKFAANPKNKKYFSNLSKLEFKKFITNADLAVGIKDNELNKISLRALYMWKEFSVFMHYSNITFGYETNVSNRDIFLLEFEETLLYCYNTIKWAFKFFEKRNHLTFIENGLDERYKIEKKR
jgi:hypothetical protein